ncbi:MAG: ComF family protein [Flavobacterium sp.]|nr:ComF family protein [Flavobacterium sp.]
MINDLINLFFPKACAGCDSFLQSTEMVICTQCRHDIPLTNHHKTENNEATSKFYGRIPVEFAGALFHFQKKGIVQELIHKLKYKGHQEIGEFIGNWYGEELKDNEILKSVDLIIPVPLHRKRLKKRGYNQVTEFGKALAKTIEANFDETILIRNIYTQTQVKKNLVDRTSVIQNVFGTNYSEKHYNKHFLLIDDVLTTGATLEACGSELMKIPGAKISIVCMAMSHL